MVGAALDVSASSVLRSDAAGPSSSMHLEPQSEQSEPAEQTNWEPELPSSHVPSEAVSQVS